MNAKALRSLVAVLAVVAGLVAAPAPVHADSYPPAAPILRLELGMHSSRGRQVGTDAQGRFVITSSWDKTARLWDASSGQLLRIFRVPSDEDSQNGMLYASGLSPDGRVAAMGGYEFDTIYLFDRQSGQMIKRLLVTGLGTVFRLRFTPDGEYLAASFFRGYAVWRCSDWSLAGVDKDVRDESYGMDFTHRDGVWTMAASSWDGKIRYYRIGDRVEKLYEYNTGSGKRPYGLSFNSDGSLLAVGYDDSSLVQVLSVSMKEMKIAYAPDLTNCSASSLLAVRFSQDGETLYAGGNWRSGGTELLRSWSRAGSGTYRDLKTGGANSITALEVMTGGGLLIGEVDPFWAIVDASGAAKAGVGAPIIDFRNGEQTFRLGSGGRALSFNGEEGSSSPLSFDTTTRTLVSTAAPSDWSLPDTTSLKVENWQNYLDPRLNGKPLVIENHEHSLLLAIAPGAKQFVLGGEFYIHAFDKDGKQLWKKAAPGTPRGVNITGDGRMAIAVFGDGTVRWYRLMDGQLILSLFPHPDGKRWVLWTPSGYYDASPGGEDLIGWQVNNGRDAAADFYPAARFRSTYYRPDIVNLVLTTLDEKQAIASANSQAGRRQDSGSILDKRPPIVLITSPDQGSVFSTGTLTVRYSLRAPDDAPVTALRALVDGRPIEGARGLTVVAAPNADQMEVSLPARDCTVSLIAENKNGSSEAASVKLVWKGAAAAEDDSIFKPTLYVLAVGVSAYKNPDYQLNYAAKDARDLAALLKKGSALYKNVQTRVLTDADADKVDILDGLDWIQKETTSRDIAVILFSGHGINDSNGNYYYLPVEANIDRLKSTGVPFSDIKTTVSSIAGKVLFFIDTCHSGNLMAGRRAADAGRDIVGVINELASAENGAVVFASSTGSQYSYEDPAWGNGAFTKALLEGLGGAAIYGSRNSVTVKELDLYLSERVKQLTGGKQTPTTTIPPNIPDFPIATKN
jgi:WD40 repeat protein